MVENVEQIEAKLAAYIDGALTPDERVELELHLEANPTHRAMIAELMGHRDLLRGLPREMAPEGWLEPLESQFERDALLGGGDPLTEFKMVRARRWWPQLLAQAAIILLAFGLGTIVYFVLPPKHPTVAIVQPPEQPQSEGEAGVGQERLARSADVALSDPAVMLRQAKDVDADANKGMAKGDVPTLAFDKHVADGASTPVEMAAVAPAIQDTLFITITADNVQQASSELRNYFVVNGIAWSESGQPEAAVTLAEATDAGAVAGDTRQPSLTNGPLADRQARPTLEKQAKDAVVLEGIVATDTVAAAQAPLGSNGSRRFGSRGEEAAAPAPPAPTASVTGRERMNASETTLVTSSVASGALNATENGEERYVVLAALDGSQAERLADALSQPGGRRRAEVRRQPVQPEAAKVMALAKAQTPEQFVRRQVARPVRVGLAAPSEATPRPQEGELSLRSPTTKPVDATSLWVLNEDASGIITTINDALSAPATQPSQPFASSAWSSCGCLTRRRRRRSPQ
jgi:hypothetical protein